MTHHSRKILVVVLLVLLVISVLGSAGCKKEEEMPTVKYRGGFMPAAQNQADWAALGEGYFEKEGIKADIDKGTGQEEATMMVAAGEYDMGMSSAVPAIMGISQGMPIQVVAMILQRNYLAMNGLENSGIQTPKDIEGRRVGIYPTGETFVMWNKFVELNDLDASSITEIPIPYGMGPLLSGEVDLMPGGIMDGALFHKEGIAPLFLFKDYEATDRYMDCLIVNKDFAEKHPDRVRAFVKAYLQGMVFCLEHPDKASEHLRHYGEGGDWVSEDFDLEGACEIVSTELFVSEETQAHGLGYSTPEKWQTLVDFLVEDGTLEKPVPVEDIFTNEYLPDPPIFAP